MDATKPWDEEADWPKQDIIDAHECLMTGGGMLGVVYRRQVKQNRDLRRRVRELEIQAGEAGKD
jgi:hypothetical protein